MAGIIWTLLRKAWWLVPIAILAAGVLYQSHELQEARKAIGALTQRVEQANATLREQNAAVLRLQAEGKAAAASAAALAAQKEKVRVQVETRWRTKLVQVPIPQDCSGAVAAAAVNAARIGKLYQEAP